MTDIPPPAGYALDVAPPPGYSLDVAPEPKAVGPSATWGVQFRGGGSSAVNTPQESFLDNTSIGRVLDAFGQGAKNGWGGEPLGISPESEKALRDGGWWNQVNSGYINIGKAFNETAMRPVAGTLDALLRAFSAVNAGAAEAVGQTVQELGMTETNANRLTRDLFMMGEMAGVALGEPAYMGTSSIPRRNFVFREGAAEAPKPLIPGEPAAPGLAQVPGMKPVVPVETAAASVSRTTLDSPDHFTHTIVNDAGEKVGHAVGSVSPQRYQITNAEILAEADRGKGFGVTAYQELADKALSEGKFLDSDVEVTASAAQMYLALERRGYTVTRNPNAKLVTDNGVEKWVAPPRSYGVFRVTAGPNAAGVPAMAIDAAPAATLKSEPVTSPVQVLPPAVDKAGNINLSRIQAPADVKQLIRETAQANDDFNFVRRGTVTWAETEQTAAAMGMTPADLLKRNIGEAFNDAEIEAMRRMFIQSATDTRAAAAKATASGAEADLLALQDAMATHALMQEQVSGVAAEAGRALNIFKKFAKADNELGDVLAKAGGRETLETLARQINELDTPQKVSKFIREAQKATTMEMIVEAWKAGLLASPVTHARNILGNMTVAVWRTAETGVAATIGGVRRLAGPADEAVLFGEVGERITGMVHGAIEGVLTSGKAFKLGAPVDDALHGTIDASNMRAIPGPVGEVIRTPFKFLAAEDEIFRGIAKRQSINQQALRKARKEGLRGDRYKSRVVELKQNPTPGMMKRAIADADYQTFTKKLGPAGQKMQSVLDQYPVARLIIPFFRTPVNIMKFAGERTVLSVASKEVRSILKGDKGAIARDEQLAKMVVGSAVATAAAALAAQGLVTGGGPKDPAERGLMRMTGWQPYSVKIGDTYYSYAGIEPIATLLGVSADAVDIAGRASDDEAENIGSAIAYSASTNIMAKTWLQGLAGIIEAAQDPERYGGKFINRLAGSAIPSGVAQAARLEDPVLRDARTMIDTIKSRVPGMSDEVYAVRDIFGDPIVRGDSLGPDAISPIYRSRETNDPAVREMMSLGIFPAKPERQIRGVELTAGQYDEYQAMAGKLLKMQLDTLVNMPGWADIPAFARKETITHTISRARESARSYVLMKHPDIMAAAVRAKIEDLGGSAGQ